MYIGKNPKDYKWKKLWSHRKLFTMSVLKVLLKNNFM